MIKTYPCLPVQVYIPSLWATEYESVQKVRTQSGLLHLPLSTGKVWDDYVLYGQTWLVGWKEGRNRVGRYRDGR